MKNLIVLVCLAFSVVGMLMIAHGLESSPVGEKRLKDATEEKPLEITADERLLFYEPIGIRPDSNLVPPVPDKDYISPNDK